MADNTEQSTSNYNKGYGKRPMWQWILIYLIIGAIAYGLIYYLVIAKRGGYNSQNTYQQPTQSASNETVSPTEATSAATTVKEISVEGNEFSFTPSTLTLKKGEEVKLTFKNTGKFPHNLVISDLNVRTKTIQPGESDSVTFTPDKTGTFSYICSVDSHADKGMTGKLTVQ